MWEDKASPVYGRLIYKASTVAVCRKLAGTLTTETPFKEVDVSDKQQDNPFISLTSNPRHDKIDDQL